MNSFFDKKLVNRIRTELSNFHTEVDEADWVLMQWRLHEHKAALQHRRRVAALCGLLAVLLVTTGLYLLRETNTDTEYAVALASPHAWNTGFLHASGAKEAPAEEVPGQDVQRQGGTAAPAPPTGNVGGGQGFLQAPRPEEAVALAFPDRPEDGMEEAGMEQEYAAATPPYELLTTLPVPDPFLLEAATEPEELALPSFMLHRRPPIFTFRRPAPVVSLVAGVFVNHGRDFSFSLPNRGGGVLFEVPLTRNLSVGTGVIYSRQQANGLLSKVQGFSERRIYAHVEMMPVEATLWMADFPINFRYHFDHRSRSGFYINIGVSNFLYERERYEYSFFNPRSIIPLLGDASIAPASSPARNYGYWRKTDLLASLNLSAGYAFYTDALTSLSIEPYMTLPLKTLGSERIEVRSAGMLFRLNFSVNSRVISE